MRRFFNLHSKEHVMPVFDRTVYNLSSTAERLASAQKRINAEEKEFNTTVYSVVLELVHPANLGPLPPSPETLMLKALSLELITMKERLSFFDRRVNLHR